ncbi:hypothetical protein, partial [Streptococcus suis]|uniref:hypothetical protein n=1 Tax=Streptococcus suis TaxID=1307 RepID=UPI001EDFDF90
KFATKRFGEPLVVGNKANKVRVSTMSIPAIFHLWIAGWQPPLEVATHQVKSTRSEFDFRRV